MSGLPDPTACPLPAPLSSRTETGLGVSAVTLASVGQNSSCPGQSSGDPSLLDMILVQYNSQHPRISAISSGQVAQPQDDQPALLPWAVPLGHPHSGVKWHGG